MSSLRNAVKRITHKERHQPKARSHLGLLEKHVDYKKRAVDKHRKDDAIQAMQRRAAMRNPDEFYTGMHRSKVHDGIHRSENATRIEAGSALDPEVIAVMKGQDLAHIRNAIARDAAATEKLQAGLHMIGTGGKKRRHTIFVGPEACEDAEGNRIDPVENFDAASHFDTVPELADRAFNRPRVSTLEDAVPRKDLKKKPVTDADFKILNRKRRKDAQRIVKAKEQSYAELAARKERIQKLRVAEAHLLAEKLASAKGRKRKIKGAEDGMPAVYKFRMKRAK